MICTVITIRASLLSSSASLESPSPSESSSSTIQGANVMNIGNGIAPARRRQSPITLHRLFDKTFGPLVRLAPVRARNQRRLWWGGFGKLILMSAITFLLAASSAEAQKNTRPIGRLLPPNISIEDVGAGNFLIFNQISGDYTFTRCSDRFTLSGVGVVRVDGCLISLESEPSDTGWLPRSTSAPRKGRLSLNS